MMVMGICSKLKEMNLCRWLKQGGNELFVLQARTVAVLVDSALAGGEEPNFIVPKHDDEQQGERDIKILELNNETMETEQPQKMNGNEEELINNICSVLREHHSKSKWNYIRRMHPQGLNTEQVIQILIKIRNRAHLAISFFEWAGKQHHFRHTIKTYCTIIHILAKARMTCPAQALMQKLLVEESKSGNAESQAFEVLVMTYRPCDSCPAVFDMLIKAYLQARRIDQAVEIFHCLKHYSIFPTVGTCNKLLHSVAMCSGTTACLDLYREMVASKITPNTQTFNTLMLGLCNNNELKLVQDIFDEMEEAGCSANLFSYNILMDAHCRRGDIRDAMILWNKMIEKCVMPDTVSYNTLISGLCSNGKMQEAEALLHQVYERGLVPTSFTYCTLIAGYCENDKAEESVQIYDEMIRNHLVPDDTTYCKILEGLCKKGKMNDATEFLCKISKRGFKHTHSTYKTMICGYCYQGDLEEAFEVQHEMARMGFEPDINIYNAFIEAFCKKGDLANAQKLAQEVLQIGLIPDNATYKTLIDALMANGNTDDALKLQNQMLENKPDSDVVLGTEFSV